MVCPWARHSTTSLHTALDKHHIRLLVIFNIKYFCLLKTQHTHTPTHTIWGTAWFYMLPKSWHLTWKQRNDVSVHKIVNMFPGVTVGQWHKERGFPDIPSLAVNTFCMLFLRPGVRGHPSDGWQCVARRLLHITGSRAVPSRGWPTGRKQRQQQLLVQRQRCKYWSRITRESTHTSKTRARTHAQYLPQQLEQLYCSTLPSVSV